MLAKNKLKKIENSWHTMPLEIKKPINKRTYKFYLNLIDELVEIVGDNEDHELASFLELVSYKVEQYEEKNVSIPEAQPVDVIRYFMDEYQLTQSDLPEIGSQGVVSEVLSGKRKLNTTQIKKLSHRFKVSPDLFFN